MDVLNLSISLPPSTTLSSFSQRNLSRVWTSNKIPQCSNMWNSDNDTSQIICGTGGFYLSRRSFSGLKLKGNVSRPPRSTGSSSSSSSSEDQENSSKKSKAPFGYTRKDVLLIGLGVTGLGVGLKYGLEFAGVNPLQAGNVVQLVLVLGLTIGWISTYIFRVSNKDMTYAKQLRDYENKVMEKRLESLTEAELEVLLEQVEEEKAQLARGNQVE